MAQGAEDREAAAPRPKKARLAAQLDCLKARRREALEREASSSSSPEEEEASCDEEAAAAESREARRGRLASLRAEAARGTTVTRRVRVTLDARGDEQLVLDGPPASGVSRVVMMRWEKPYMEALADALGVGGDDDVLEIGYGLGFSAARIAAARPRTHAIVECDAAVAARAAAAGVASAMAAACRGVGVVRGRPKSKTESSSESFAYLRRPSSARDEDRFR